MTIFANKLWSAYHFQYFQNNPILKSWDCNNTPDLPTLKAYPTPGEVVCSKLKRMNLTLKEPGFLDPSHSRGGGADSAPLRSRKPIDEISSVWY